MSPGEKLATSLTSKFLEEGNFLATPAMKSLPGMGATAALAVSTLDEGMSFFEGGFSGLAVQAVGYEEGGSEEKVHIYVLIGSSKPILIPVGNKEVTVEINRMRWLVVKPEQAFTTTRRGNHYLKDNRVACGSSCAPSGENYSGTFGAIIKKTGSKHLYLLSNNHVFAACNHTPVGMPILSPSNADGKAKGRAPGEIARHSEISELRSGTPQLVPPCEEDVAIATVTDPNAISSWQGDDANGYDTPSKTVKFSTGLRVKKFGRTTGFTTGTVESKIPNLIYIPYKTKHFNATVWFKNVWTIVGDKKRPFALPGDSGSLIVTEDGKFAVGLIFATAGTDYAIAIPIEQALKPFGGCTLVSGHG